jgi:hypothetical protein
MFLESKARPERWTDILAAIFEPIVAWFTPAPAKSQVYFQKS